MNRFPPNWDWRFFLSCSTDIWYSKHWNAKKKVFRDIIILVLCTNWLFWLCIISRVTLSPYLLFCTGIYHSAFFEHLLKNCLQFHGSILSQLVNAHSIFLPGLIWSHFQAALVTLKSSCNSRLIWKCICSINLSKFIFVCVCVCVFLVLCVLFELFERFSPYKYIPLIFSINTNLSLITQLLLILKSFQSPMMLDHFQPDDRATLIDDNPK